MQTRYEFDVKLTNPVGGPLQQPWVTSLAFSPDGTTLAVGTANCFLATEGEVVLWDMQTRSKKATFQGGMDGVWAVAYAPVGKTLAIGGEDGTVKLCDGSTGTERATLKGHTGTITALAFDQTGATLASASGDRTVRLWDVGAAAERAVLKGHSAIVYSVAFAPDGNVVASCGEDNGVKLWDAVTGQLRITLPVPATRECDALAFSPDGKTLAVGGAGIVKLLCAATDMEAARTSGPADPKAGKPAVEPSTPVKPSTEWTNILLSVDPVKHVVAGQWERKGTDLIASTWPFARIVVPVTPTGGYELKVNVTRFTRDAEVNVMLPVGEAMCMFTLNKDWQGLQVVEPSQEGKDRVRSRRGRPRRPGLQSVHCGVPGRRERDNRADVDGKPVVRWWGLRSALSQREIWRIHSGSLGFGVHDGAAAFHSVELRTTSGTAKRFDGWEKTQDVAGTNGWMPWRWRRCRSTAFAGPGTAARRRLRVEGEEFSRVAIPVAPTASYEVSATYTREKAGGDEINVILPVADTACMFSINTTHTYLQQVRGGEGNVSNDVRPDEFPNGQRHTVNVRVTLHEKEERIEARLDGKLQVDWHGPLTALAPREDWRLCPNSLGLGVHNDVVVFHSVSVRRIVGEASGSAL